MNAPTPQTVASDLQDQLNNMALSKQITEISIRRVQIAARALKNADINAYYSIMGRCACLLGNLPEMRKFLSKGISLDPTNPHTYLDFGISESMWGFHREAWVHMENALKFGDHDPAILRWILRSCWQSCRFIAAHNVIERLKTLNAELDDDLNPFPAIELAYQLFIECNLTDEQGLEAAEIYGKYLRSKSLFNLGETISYVRYSEVRPHITYSAYVDGYDLEELNLELYEQFANNNIEIEQEGFLIYAFTHKDIEIPSLVA